MANTERRFFTDEYKRQTVDLVGRVADPSARLRRRSATRFGSAQMGNEVWGGGAAGGGDTAPDVEAVLPTADQASEIAKLKRENDRLRMERDILKKSIAIFAGTRT